MIGTQLRCQHHLLKSAENGQVIIRCHSTTIILTLLASVATRTGVRRGYPPLQPARSADFGERHAQRHQTVLHLYSRGLMFCLRMTDALIYCFSSARLWCTVSRACVVFSARSSPGLYQDVTACQLPGQTLGKDLASPTTPQQIMPETSKA